MLTDEAVAALQEWPKLNGYSIINFCPGCMRQVWSKANALRILRLICDLMVKDPDPKLTKELTKRVGRGPTKVFGFFVASDPELVKALDYRIIVYPVCHDCEPYIESEDWTDFVETNLEGSRQSLPIVNITGGDFW